MTFLTLLLAFKIAVTFMAVSAPLLFAPAATLTRKTRTEPSALPWLRLYGIAVTALLFGYASGFWMLAADRFPWGVVLMGIFSNGGAAAVMIATGMGKGAPLKTTFFAAIAVGLVVAAAIPAVAMERLF